MSIELTYVRPAGGIKRNTFPLDNLHFSVRVMVQSWTFYFPLTENKTTSNRSTFRQKLTSKAGHFSFKKVTRYRPHSVVVRLLDTTRTDRLEQVQTITTHRMSFESTTSSLLNKKLISIASSSIVKKITQLI